MRQVGSGSYFCYDKNGNMTKRVEGGVTYVQSFTVENELSSVTVDSNITSFSYDASGQRVKTVELGNKITYFPFPNYAEGVNGSTVTRRVTYTVAGQAVANRVQVVGGANTLYYLYSDHLGSTVAQSSTSGTLVSGSLTYYLPYGSYRGTAPTQTLTDRDFTGQKENRELGLLYYNARFYVPSIGRFLSADTLVPSPASPQSFNRYSYVRNSPLNRIDPTGHIDCALLPSGECDHNVPGLVSFDTAKDVNETWGGNEMGAIYQGAYDLGSAYARDLNARAQGAFSKFGDNGYANITSEDAFMSVYGGSVSFEKRGVSCEAATGYDCYAQTQTSRSIFVFTDIYNDDGISRIPRPTTSNRWAVHELGHAFESRVNGKAGTWGYVRDQLPNEILNRNGFAGTFPGWQQSTNTYEAEIFADMVVGWTYGQWETDRLGLTDAANLKANFMTTNMSDWIDIAR